MSAHPGDKPVLRFIAQFFGLGTFALFGVLALIAVSIVSKPPTPAEEAESLTRNQERSQHLDGVLAEQKALVTEAKWIDEEAKIAQLPVEQAKSIVLAELQKKPLAASTALVPGATPPPAAPEPEPEAPKADAPTIAKETDAAETEPKPAQPKAMVEADAAASAEPVEPEPVESAKAAEPPANPELAAAGQIVYQTYCLACHGPDAKATMIPGMAPSLVGSEILMGPSEATAMTLLHGIEPEGRYTGVMVAWNALLNDEQIAAVLTYLRTNFGNSGAPITPEQMAWAREKYKDQKGSFTRAEIVATQSLLPYPVPGGKAAESDDDSEQQP